METSFNYGILTFRQETSCRRTALKPFMTLTLITWHNEIWRESYTFTNSAIPCSRVRKIILTGLPLYAVAVLARDRRRVSIQNQGPQWIPLKVSKLCTVKQRALIKGCIIGHRMRANCLPTPPKSALMRSHFSKNVSWFPIPHYSSYTNMNTRSRCTGDIYISVIKFVSLLFLFSVVDTKWNHEQVSSLFSNDKSYVLTN